MNLKLKPKPKPKGKPKPRPRPTREKEENPQVGVGDTVEEGKVKQDSKLNAEPLILRFTGEGKTIVFSAIDQMRLAVVVDDFLTSNKIQFEKTQIGGQEPNGDDTGDHADE